MQIFIPYADFKDSVKALDSQRLNKQILEVSTIIRIVESDAKNGWSRHVAVTMWRPYPEALKAYKNACIAELKTRRTKRGLPWKMDREIYQPLKVPDSWIAPPFLGDEQIHSRHRGNLLRKAWERKCRGEATNRRWMADHWYWYRRLGWIDPFYEGYLWVVPQTKDLSQLVEIRYEPKPTPRNPDRKVSVRYVIGPYTI